MNKINITIGIPAFNEEKNISYLISDILNQKLEKDIDIKKIIIASDGSTDNTIDSVKEIKEKKILIFDNKKRKGLATMLNLIIKNSNTEILIIINADTRLSGNNFILNLTKPIISNNVDLVTPDVVELGNNSLMEKTLQASNQIKSNIYNEFREGQSIYTCRGVARAFSRNFYKNIYFKDSVGEDAYTYLFCKSNNYKYKNIKSAKIIYKIPTNFLDHKNQSARFFNSVKLMKKEFKNKFVEKEYSIPKIIIIKSVIKEFLKNPIFTFFYLAIVLIMRINTFFNSQVTTNLWDISSSSKEVYE